MPKAAIELKALDVQRLTAPGLHFVGVVPGLALQVLPSGGRTWILRAMVAGKRRDMGLGGYPAVTLAQARELARTARERIKAGHDPVAEAKAARSAQAASRATALTFHQCAEKYIAAHKSGWKSEKHAQQWTNTLDQHAYPTLGQLLVRDIGLTHILAVLEPIWQTKTETASRLRGRIESVLDWAAVRNYREGENPARWRGHLDKILPKPTKVSKVEHHAAMPIDEVAPFLVRLRTQDGMGSRALEFTVLTGCRSGEVRGATWAEIDLQSMVWTIPAERMKAGKEHRVPLSPGAVKVLEALPRIAGTDVVFPGVKGQPLSDMTLTATLRRMQVDATVHGFRSTFRDWAGERTAHPREVIEHALAHRLKDKVEAAYQRGDLFEKRRKLMDDWAAFLTRTHTAADVIELHGAREKA